MKIKLLQIAAIDGVQMSPGQITEVSPVFGMALIETGFAELVTEKKAQIVEISDPEVEETAVRTRKKRG
jgi:hypothetical protein